MLVSMLMIIIGLIMLSGILRLMVYIVRIILFIRIVYNNKVFGLWLKSFLMFIKLVFNVLGNKVLMVFVIKVVSINC